MNLKTLRNLANRCPGKARFLFRWLLEAPDAEARPSVIRLDASSACQLRCPSCPTSEGVIRDSTVGTKLLRFEDFQRVVDQNPKIKEIELSNWGEIFLNHDLLRIVAYADSKGTALHAGNGVNFNTVSDEMLEALVKYRFRRMTISIDGTTPESYAIYRKRGDFQTVMGNIHKLNQYKRAYGSPFPILTWQFVLFQHTRHQLAAARSMASDLNMSFYPKMCWDREWALRLAPLFKLLGLLLRRSPELWTELELYRTIFLCKFTRPARAVCRQLWIEPQVNSDGKILGCCINTWGDFGNAFDSADLTTAFNNEKIRYARLMVSGQAEARDGIPCTNCREYHRMKKWHEWVSRQDLDTQPGHGPRG